jgi:hypothetical protein
MARKQRRRSLVASAMSLMPWGVACGGHGASLLFVRSLQFAYCCHGLASGLGLFHVITGFSSVAADVVWGVFGCCRVVFV